MKHLNTPLGQKVHSVDTVAEMSGLPKSVGLDFVYCVATSTLYSYSDYFSSPVNGTSVLATADGGDTRWVGIAGRFSYYPTNIETEINVIQDETNISHFQQPHATCHIPTTNQIFVGCRSNYIFVFGEDDLSTVVFSQNIGYAINACCYDATQDKVYFTGNNTIWEYDPSTGSATDLSVPITLGTSPAIASDGAYIYGVTYTNPAIFFKVDITNPTAAPVTTTWTNGNSGHACVLHKYTSKTELYCTATDSNVSGGKSQFAAVDCDTMAIIIDVPVLSYQATDDVAYQNVNDTYGYCYITPENNHIGIKIKTDDGTYTEFYSPYSYGSFTDGSHLYIADLFSDSIYKYPNFELDKYEVYTFHPTFEQQKLEFDLVPTAGSFVINFTNNMLLTVNATDSIESIQANLTNLRAGVTDFYTITGSFTDGFTITFNGLVGDISDITTQDNTLLDGLGSGVTITVSEVTKGIYNRKPNELIITPNGRMFYTSFVSPCHVGEISLGKWEYTVQPYSIIEGEGINNNSPYSFIQGVKNINEAQSAVLIGNYIYNKGENVFIIENLEYLLTGTPITTAYKNNTESNIAKFFGANRINASGLLYYPRYSEQTFGSTTSNAPIDIKPNIPTEMFPQDTYYASTTENTTTPGIYDDGDSLSYNIYPYYESSTEGQVFGNPYSLSIIFSPGVSNCSMDINDVTLVAATPLQLAPTGYRFVRLYNGTTSFVDIAYASPINLNDNGTDVGGTAWTTLSEADAISPAVGTGCTESTFGVPGVSSFASLAVGISGGVGSSRSSLRGSVSTKIRNIYKSETIAQDDHVVNLMAAGLTLELTIVDSSRDRHYYINNISTGNATVIPSVGSTDTFTGGETSLVLRPNTSVHIVAQYAGGTEDKWRIVFNTSELASLVDLDLKVPAYTDHFWNGLNKEWASKVTTGTIDFLNSVNGEVELTTGATNTNEESINWDDIETFNTSHYPHFEVKMRHGQTVTTYSEVGFYNTTEYMKFYVDTSVDQYWRFEVSNGGAPVTITTSIEISTADQVFKFDWIDDTTVAIWVDGILIGSADISTVKPAGNMQPIMMVKTLDDVAAKMVSNYIKIWQDEEISLM